MNKFLKNEHGMTLVELLAAIIIGAIVSFFIFQFLYKGMENTKIIQTENFLRDEADIIISRFVKELYTTKQSHIVRLSSLEGSYLEVTNDITKCPKNEDGSWAINSECENTLYKIGFITNDSDTSIIYNDERYTVQNNNITISSASYISGDPDTTSLYEIHLELEATHKKGNDIVKKKDVF